MKRTLKFPELSFSGQQSVISDQLWPITDCWLPITEIYGEINRFIRNPETPKNDAYQKTFTDIRVFPFRIR